MAKTVTLRNAFHGTEARVKVGALSPATVRRVRRELCGSKTCACSSTLGIRGPQDVAVGLYDGEHYAALDRQAAERWAESADRHAREYGRDALRHFAFPEAPGRPECPACDEDADGVDVCAHCGSDL